MDPKRRRSSPAVPAYADLSEEDQLLLRLKDGASLPWKEIALCFQSEMGKTFQVPALQMRYKRLRERMRPWSEVDVEALRRAHDYWDRFKWDIIAVKMLDHGCSDKWPSKACQRKWEELHPDLEREGSRACSIRGSGDSDRGTPYPTTPRASFSSPAVHLST
ncbi:MAG: hypothetical protein M1817_002214 [Caeruleum heppii]|nr:MAG: hypothetical protein M1817_002214 [Caeruleum heppii]